MPALARLLPATTLLLPLVLLMAGPASAASPLIGGRLTAGHGDIEVESTSTMPVRVTFDAEYVKVSPSMLIIQPGQIGHASYTGEGLGEIAAHLVSVDPLNVQGDSANATLVVKLAPYVPPPTLPVGPLGLAALLTLALGLALRRFRPWELRLHRSAA